MNSPINVNFILPSFAGGGAERVLLTILARLDRDRFASSLVVLSGDGPLAGCVPADVQVINLARPRVRQAIPALRRVLGQQKPSIVFSTMAHLNAGVLALQPSLPAVTRYVVREANIPLSGLTGAKRALQRLAYRRLYPRAHAIVCPARRVADGVVGVVPRAADKVSVIHNPVEVLGLRARAKRPVRRPGEGLRLVAVGRLTHQKGFDRLIDLMPSFPPSSHLTIIGDGPDRSALGSSNCAPGYEGSGGTSRLSR